MKIKSWKKSDIVFHDGRTYRYTNSEQAHRAFMSFMRKLTIRGLRSKLVIDGAEAVRINNRLILAGGRERCYLVETDGAIDSTVLLQVAEAWRDGSIEGRQ